jgi:hypothetical protein
MEDTLSKCTVVLRCFIASGLFCSPYQVIVPIQRTEDKYGILKNQSLKWLLIKLSIIQTSRYSQLNSTIIEKVILGKLAKFVFEKFNDINGIKPVRFLKYFLTSRRY